ncbi:DUF192 domain-containing protein [Synechococcus sp. RSCCF101]|uniref:DUF192 domain-containing protein n=1 Tax=Synechococcus sp. RSCCF101 TaxID=2511069 RepID=UPI00124820B8|nr:DUF192 domain-containing protein [Synechococcus sp. RSCCF101]QEY31953.1 DUF192 domain-containing protein [Synechococcus sp. RSCCF101]
MAPEAWPAGPALRPLLIGLLLGAPAAAAPPPQVLPLEARWCLPAGPCLELEVADTPEEQRWGLMLRPALPRGRGMWFPFASPRRARFWMHRTPASLDMLFVRHGRIMAIEHAAAPCPRLPCPSYGPAEPVDGVLELGAGEARRLGLAVGDAFRTEPIAARQTRGVADD